jgi:hypothetical protein
MGIPSTVTVSDFLRTRMASWTLLVAFTLEAFVLSPLLGMGVVPAWIGALGTSVTLVAAAMALHGRRGMQWFLAGVVALALIAHWGHVVTDRESAALVKAGATLVSCAIFAVLFLHDVFSAGRLPSRLLSVLFAYLFMGSAWAGAYHLAEILRPGSLSLPGTHHPASEFMYFSFSTLTSVGYGDVLPVGPLVRSLAVLEALTGQLYLVLVVSRFVGERVAGVQSGDLGDPAA